MITHSQPLLSIVIPTKNRQHTCLCAIEGALLLKKADIEIIVQDCSDDEILRQQIIDKFGSDSRIIYEYINSKPSMTDNWNKAYENSTGKYIIGIGDDDGILPEVYEVAKWADSNSIDVVGHTEPYSYLWRDYPIKHYQGSLIVREFNGSVSLNENLLDTVNVRSKYADMGYAIDLPMVYHRLISRTLYEKLKSLTGKFLDGTSLDVYSSFTIGLIAEKFIIIDYPFSFKGACASSNSGRIINKKDKEHFDEFSDVDYPNWMPRIKIVHVSIAESIYRSFKNTNNEHLLPNLSLPYLYAVCIIDRPDMMMSILKLSFRYFTDFKQWFEFFKLLISKFYSIRIRRLPMFFAKKLDGILPIYSIYRKFLIKKRRIFLLNNTLEVMSFHRNYVKSRGVSLNLPNK